MQRLEIEERVLDVMAASLKCAVGTKTRRGELAAWDSLRHIEMVFAIEDELEVRFSEEELTQLDSVAAIVDAIAAKACATAM